MGNQDEGEDKGEELKIWTTHTTRMAQLKEVHILLLFDTMQGMSDEEAFKQSVECITGMVSKTISTKVRWGQGRPGAAMT
jgi:hypothetical protein